MAKKQSFETALKDLEEIVEQLEDGGLSLEDSLALFEKGVGRATACRQALQAVELKVEKLVEQARGQLVAEAVVADEDTEN